MTAHRLFSADAYAHIARIGMSMPVYARMSCAHRHVSVDTYAHDCAHRCVNADAYAHILRIGDKHHPRGQCGPHTCAALYDQRHVTSNSWAGNPVTRGHVRSHAHRHFMDGDLTPECRAASACQYRCLNARVCVYRRSQLMHARENVTPA